MDAEEYLNQIPMWAKEKNSLEDIRVFLEYLGSPDRQVPVIHVAGTNGKGSVCAFLTYALRRAGYHVGTFTSPHLVELRERFLLDGEMAGKAQLEWCFRQVKEATGELAKKGLHHPTFFEFLFYMAALFYAREKVDFWIMETGLGGRLDTTNVVEHPLVSVITSISLDHTKYLGTTIKEIAGEKAGIIKEGVPVVYDANCQEAASVIETQAHMLHAKAFPVCRRDFRVYKEQDFASAGSGRGKGRIVLELGGSLHRPADGCTATHKSLGAHLESQDAYCLSGGRAFSVRNRRIRLPFEAAYQGDNGALAWKTLEVLMEEGWVGKNQEELLCLGMEETRWPGRMEEILPGVFLDGAHNPGGMEAFVKAARAVAQGREGKIFILFAAVADKDYRNMVQCLWRELKPDLAAAACLKSERSLSADKLNELLGQEMGCPTECFADVKAALKFLLREKGSRDYLFCVGSLYLVGEVRAELSGRRYDIQ